jgi:hypothetical protein
LTTHSHQASPHRGEFRTARSDANSGAIIETFSRFTHAKILNNTRILDRRVARSIAFFSSGGVENVPKWSNFVSKNRVARNPHTLKAATPFSQQLASNGARNVRYQYSQKGAAASRRSMPLVPKRQYSPRGEVLQ